MHCCKSNQIDCNLKTISKFNSYKKITSNKKLFDQNCKLMFCKKCNFFKKEINNDYKKNIKKIYKSYTKLHSDRFYQEVDQIKAYKPKKYRAEITLEKLEKKLSILKYNNYLDYGCGLGAISNALIKNKISGKKIYCFDKINILHKNIRKKINTFYKDRKSIKKKFDVIYLNHVLEHVFQPEEEIIFLKKIMNEKGLLVIQIPNIDLGSSLYDLFIYDHAYHFTKKSFISFFSRFYFNLVYFDTKLIPGNIIGVFKKSKKKLKKHKINNNNTVKFDKFFSKINQLFIEMKNYKTLFFYGASLITLFYCSNFKNKKIIIFDDNKNIREKYNKNIKIYHSSKIKNYQNITLFSSINKKIFRNLDAFKTNNRFKFL